MEEARPLVTGVPSAVFVDTSALYALFIPSDDDHEAARAALSALRKDRTALVGSNVVLLESYVLVHARAGRGALLRFRETVGTSAWLRVVDVSDAQDDAAWDLLRRRADKDYSYVDATSFVLMREAGISRAFAFDDHFRQAGFEVLPAPSRLRRR